MEQALSPWTGHQFTMPGEPGPAAQEVYRVRRWSLRIGRDWITLSSISESYGPIGGTPIAGDRRSTLRLAAAAVAGGLALLLAGATAGRAWSAAPIPRETAMIVPDATPFVAPMPGVRTSREHRLSSGRAKPLLAASPIALLSDSESPSDPASTLLSRADAIERALRTGEFQEWADRDGATGFAVPGAAERGGAGACRALAVLVRKPDGTDAVINSRMCGPAGQAGRADRLADGADTGAGRVGVVRIAGAPRLSAVD